MQSLTTRFSLVLAVTAVLTTATIVHADDKTKAITPFNGKDLTGWLAKGGSPEKTLKVGKAKLDPDNRRALIVEAGGHDLVFKGGARDFYTAAKFGDAVIELEFMVPKGSNSGVYVMGEYEVQILDSYGKEKVGAGDVGGLYGAQAPRVNAAKAPGQWQKFVIDFRAPKFDDDGKKIANARFVKVTLNGQVIHEDVEMKRPTPGGVSGKEAAQGPIMFQGNHGPVAYRNITIAPIDQGQKECLISLWNHRRNLDPSPLVKELGFNLIWSHDQPYTGQKWEETHMHKLLSTTGVKYVFAKIERAAWGWSHDQSLKHAKWVAQLSMEHPGILGMYLNDFYDEVEEGHRTEEQWREIIKAAKDINPNFQLWVPHYPHRNQGRHAFDFDIDGVILNLWGNDPKLMARAREHIEAGLVHHPDRQVIAGLYLKSGSDGGRWLSEKEFKEVLGLYVELVNEGKLTGLRIFSAGQLLERPEYQKWAKEILTGLKRL